MSPMALKRHLEQLNKVVSNISLGYTPTGGAGTPPAPAPGNSVQLKEPNLNMDGQKILATAPVTPNTEFAVAHNLGRVPQGFIFLGGSNSGAIYRGTTPWTATQVFLKDTGGSNVFYMLLI
jgi:hypothetical protein